MRKKIVSGILSFLGCGVMNLWADNPLVNYHYLADPTAFVIGDRFWIICDLDDESVSGYNIKAYYALSSKDMKNWTDHGEVFRVPRDVPWAGSAWAPAAAWRNNTVYIYYPNATSGIGVATAPTPVGPYKDPVGRAIVNHNAAQGNYCDNVVWCFDPGVFIDTDGQAYLIWGGGGGEANKPTYGENFRMMKLKSDMITLEGPLIRVTGTTNSFEAPYITKRNNLYYLSYNARAQTIEYATSNSPTGPWTYRGVVMRNPNINGQNINVYNNNHHGFAEFKGKWYVAYHDRRVAIANNDPKPDLHRNVSLDLLEYNADGTFKEVVFTHSGPPQIANFNPYDSVPATTGAAQQGIRSRTMTVTNAPPYSLLIPKPSQTAWERLSNVDFGSGASKFVFNASSLNANNKIEIRTGSANGTLAATCNLPNTGSWNSFSTVECPVSGLSGVVSNLYIRFTGTDSSCAVRWWKFIPAGGASSSSGQSSSVLISSSSRVSSSSVLLSSSSSVARAAYSSATIPGTIQAENYDLGGEGVAYHDNDAVNSGSVYRNDGVDITGDAADGYKVGWTVAGEWLEYSVRVDSAGAYRWEARVSAGGDGAAFRMRLGSVDIGAVQIPNTGSWDTYATVSGTTPVLTPGQQILRITITGSYGNIDWIRFAKNDAPVFADREKIRQGESAYKIYDARGAYYGEIAVSASQTLAQGVLALTGKNGVYLVRNRAGVLQRVVVYNGQ